MTLTQQLLSSIASLALPLGSALVAAGLILKALAAHRKAVSKDLAGLKKKLEEQGRDLDALIAGQAQFATQASLDEVLKSQQRNALEAMLLAGHAFVDQRRRPAAAPGESRES